MPFPPDVRADFAFTPADTPRLRARVLGDLARIAEAAHRADPRLRALALTGSFSRGEGTALDDAPVNDYDVVAIRDAPGGGARYRAFGHQLGERLGIEVDLLPIWRARLPYVGRKLFWLDARLSARVVSGEPRALSGLRAFGAGSLERGELARLLGNRAAGLLLSIPGEHEAPDPFQRDLQACKAAIAAMDATLLARGEYFAHMRDRLHLTRGHGDHATFAHAVAWKLSPAHILPDEWWQRARDALLRAVDATGALRHRDGFAERVSHAARAGRLALAPSQAVRHRAWALLARSVWPDGPAGVEWPTQKRAFFAQRAKTLQ